MPADLPGVYVLSAFVPARPLLTVFYAGQSGNLRRRIAEHLSGQKTFAVHLRTRLSTYFSVAMVSHPEIRSAADAALIRHLQPAGNACIPHAPPIAVSLPPLLLFNLSDGSCPT